MVARLLNFVSCVLIIIVVSFCTLNTLTTTFLDIFRFKKERSNYWGLKIGRIWEGTAIPILLILRKVIATTGSRFFAGIQKTVKTLIK
jgi:hypothetical protein